MREFQFAGEEKNKPEVEDDRCRKRLKEKFLKLKVRNDHMISSNKWHGDIKTDSYRTISWDNNETRKVYTRGSEGVDKFVEALDDVSEEMCCGILEAIQEMAVKGRDWYTTQLENLNQGEGYSAVDFPDYQKSIPIKTSKGRCVLMPWGTPQVIEVCDHLSLNLLKSHSSFACTSSCRTKNHIC